MTKPFIYGMTKCPKRTTDIYLPVSSLYVTQYSGEQERIDIPLEAQKMWVDRNERHYLKTRGHRAGIKGVTLSDKRG